MSRPTAQEQIAEFRVREFGADFGDHALDLARHAALPVALSPELLNLLRLNFFAQSSLPWITEAYLLLSPLCRDIGGDLYEIEPAARNILLRQLLRIHGDNRLREIATLLWEYGERHRPWAKREGLYQAQQLTAKLALDPRGAAAWLDHFELVGGGYSEHARTWSVAMRRDADQLERIRPTLLHSADELYQILLRFDFYSQAETFQRTIDRLPVAGFLIHGPLEHGQHWLLNRLLQVEFKKASTAKVIRVNFSRRTRGTDIIALWRELGMRVGVLSQTDAPRSIILRLVDTLRAQSLVLIFDRAEDVGENIIRELITEFLAPLIRLALQESRNNSHSLLMFILHESDEPPAWIDLFESQPDLANQDNLIAIPPREPFSAREIKLLMDMVMGAAPGLIARDLDRTVDDILANSAGGVPQLVIEYIFTLAGYNWYEGESRWLKY